MRYGAVTYYRIKVTGAEQTEKNAKKVYPVMEVISVAVKIVVEVVRCAYVQNNKTDKEQSINVRVTDV